MPSAAAESPPWGGGEKSPVLFHPQQRSLLTHLEPVMGETGGRAAIWKGYSLNLCWGDDFIQNTSFCASAGQVSREFQELVQ